MKKLLLSLAALLLVVTSAQAADVGQLIIKAADAETYSASWTGHNLDAATDQMEYFFQCEEACSITDLCARQNNVTGTAPTYEFRLEGVNTSARADGTVKSSGNAKGDITLPGANLTFCTTLTSSYACTKGEFLAGVIDYRTGTISGSAFAGFTYQNGAGFGTSYPYTYTVDAGTGTRRNGNSIPIGYKCGSTFYGNVIQSYASEDYGSGSTPDERGNVFTIPSGSCSTFKLDGARFYGYVNVAASTVDYVVYEGTTVRQTLTVDTDVAAASQNYMDVKWSEGYTFSCGTAYRVVAKPANAGGTSQGVGALTYANAGQMNSLPLGTSMYYTGRTDAGAWTDTTTKRAVMDLVVSDITAAGGSSPYSRGAGGNLQ